MVAELGARVLVVGPARSGKSSWAEAQLATQDVDYVATSQVRNDDPEWQERVALHRGRRPAAWRTIESIDLAGLLAVPGSTMLVDCLGVWLSRVMDEAGVWQQTQGARERVLQRVAELLRAVAETPRRVIFVSNEVGAGLVPADEASRYYRDQLGILNAQLAAVVDETWLCYVGVAKRWV